MITSDIVKLNGLAFAAVFDCHAVEVVCRVGYVKGLLVPSYDDLGLCEDLLDELPHVKKRPSAATESRLHQNRRPFTGMDLRLFHHREAGVGPQGGKTLRLRRRTNRLEHATQTIRGLTFPMFKDRHDRQNDIPKTTTTINKIVFI